VAAKKVASSFRVLPLEERKMSKEQEKKRREGGRGSPRDDPSPKGACKTRRRDFDHYYFLHEPQEEKVTLNVSRV